MALTIGADGIEIGAAGLMLSAAQAGPAYNQPPALPAQTLALTWEGAGDETRGNGGVQEGTAGDWDDGTLTYKDLVAVWNTASGSVTLQLPAGDFQLNSTAGASLIDRSNVGNTGEIITAIRGTVDGNGNPITCIKGKLGGGAMFEISPSGDPRTQHVIFKDLELGEFQSVIDAWDGVDTDDIDNGGSEAVAFVKPCRLTIINCRIRGFGGDGIQSGSGYEEYLYNGEQLGYRQVSVLKYFDTETYLVGTSNNHGTYCHGIFVQGFRSSWHDINDGHCLKLDADYYFEDCTIENAVGATYSGVKNDRAINMNGFGSGMFYRCNLPREVDPSISSGFSRSIWFDTRRNGGGWGYSNRIIPWWIQDRTGSGNSIPSRIIPFENDGDGGAAIEAFRASTSGTYTASDATITINSWSRSGNDGGPEFPVDTGSNAYTIVATDGTTLERKTATLDAAITSFGDDGVFTLSSTFSINMANNHSLFVLGADGPDLPLLNAEFWDADHADYYWDKVQSGGSIIKTATDSIERVIFEKCIFTTTNNNASAGTQALIQWVEGGPHQSMTDDSVELPLPPMDSPTASWSDVAGSAKWDWVAGTSYMTGDDPSSPDFLFPVLYAFGDCVVIDLGTEGFTQDGTSSIRNSPFETQAIPFNPSVTTLEGGVEADVATAGSGYWMPTTNQTTLDGAVALDAVSLVVASATGMAAGKTISIAKHDAVPGEVPTHVTTIGSGYTSGTTIPIDDPMPWAADSGDDLGVTAAMGTKPSWWITGSSWV